ncbi:MAG TPA: hypothetical protein VK585_09095, partial [Jiangellaceae bacterium]|nr:hypothetical protein [Jiangellaceae bacterium]
RRRHRPGWPPHHAIGMGGSYIALLTGFYVDNGPFLPLWKELPHVTFWLLPSIIGVPLIWFALHRYRRTTSRTRPDGDPTPHRLDAKPPLERLAPDISDKAGIPHP